MNFIAQGMDSCCFVYAVANFQIWKGIELPDLEKAKDLALCRNGGTIKDTKVVEYFRAELEKTDSYEQVFEKGGIININHPIWNGHTFLVFPTERGITAVNSWLGPLVAEGLGRREIMQFAPIRHNQFGSLWMAK